MGAFGLLQSFMEGGLFVAGIGLALAGIKTKSARRIVLGALVCGVQIAVLIMQIHDPLLR